MRKALKYQEYKLEDWIKGSKIFYLDGIEVRELGVLKGVSEEKGNVTLSLSNENKDDSDHLVKGFYYQEPPKKEFKNFGYEDWKVGSTVQRYQNGAVVYYGMLVAKTLSAFIQGFTYLTFEDDNGVKFNSHSSLKDDSKWFQYAKPPATVMAFKRMRLCDFKVNHKTFRMTRGWIEYLGVLKGASSWLNGTNPVTCLTFDIGDDTVVNMTDETSLFFQEPVKEEA